jgi:23S rRNA pseudouridine1911/1915/1917 synthase
MSEPEPPALATGRTSAAGRLDALLAELAGVARAEAVRWIEAGRVTVDDVPATTKNLRVGEGRTISWRTPPRTTSPRADADVPFDVVVDDPDFLVVDKPAGVVVHPSAGHADRTLVNGLMGLGAAGGDPQRPGIVHRLDRDTSGLLLVARSEETHGRLQAMIRDRSVERRYLALVAGAPDAEAGRIDGPIGRHPTRRTEQAVVAGGRAAITHFTVVERLPDHTLLEVRLETGRTHQVRVHLRAIGLHVVGDPVYGRPGLGLSRQFLHAHDLRLPHPRTGIPIRATSDLPGDLAAALALARAGA